MFLSVYWRYSYIGFHHCCWEVSPHLNRCSFEGNLDHSFFWIFREFLFDFDVLQFNWYFFLVHKNPTSFCNSHIHPHSFSVYVISDMITYMENRKKYKIIKRSNTRTKIWPLGINLSKYMKLYIKKIIHFPRYITSRKW